MLTIYINNNVKQLKVENKTYLANNEYDTVIDYLKIYNQITEQDWKFCNQSVISISKKLFKYRTS